MEQPNTHIIWHNDINAFYENLYSSNMQKTKDEQLPDEQLWQEAHAMSQEWMDNVKNRMDIELDYPIILIGTIQQWDKQYNVQKNLKTYNIGHALETAVQCFKSENEFTLYCEDNKLLLSQTGHDNPVAPSILEFRMLTCDPEDIDTCIPVKEQSVSIGSHVNTIFGWNGTQTE